MSGLKWLFLCPVEDESLFGQWFEETLAMSMTSPTTIAPAAPKKKSVSESAEKAEDSSCSLTFKAAPEVVSSFGKLSTVFFCYLSGILLSVDGLWVIEHLLVPLGQLHDFGTSGKIDIFGAHHVARCLLVHVPLWCNVTFFHLVSFGLIK